MIKCYLQEMADNCFDKRLAGGYSAFYIYMFNFLLHMSILMEKNYYHIA